MLMTLSVFSNIKFNSNRIKKLFYRIKINSYGFYVIKKITGEEGFIKVQEEEMYYC